MPSYVGIAGAYKEIVKHVLPISSLKGSTDGARVDFVDYDRMQAENFTSWTVTGFTGSCKDRAPRRGSEDGLIPARQWLGLRGSSVSIQHVGATNAQLDLRTHCEASAVGRVLRPMRLYMR